MTFRFSRLSIRTQLILLVVIALVPAFAAFLKDLLDERQAARAAVQAQLKVHAEIVATRLGAYFNRNDAVLGRLAQRPQVRLLDARHCDPILREYVSLHPEFTNVVVRDLAGANECSVFANTVPQAKALTLPWFARALQSNEVLVSDGFVGPQSGRWVAVMSHPVRDDAGKPTGLLLLPTDLLQLNREMMASAPPGVTFTVTDLSRKIVLRSADPEQWIGQPPPAISSATQGQAQGYAAGGGVDGVRRLFAFTQVPKVGWRVVAGMREDEAFAAVNAVFRRGVLIGSGILLLACALAWWMARAMVRPIESLARTVERLVEGDSTVRAPLVHGPAEVEAVTLGLNRMLHKSEQRHRALLDTVMDGFWLADTQGRLLEVNDTYCRMSGYAEDELLRMCIADLEAVETPERAAAHLQEVMAQGEDRFETAHRRKDGSVFAVEVSVQFRSLEGGRLVVFVQDISKRKRAEEELRSSLLEKVALLKEVHHRVKNNLQVITSLLRLETGRSVVPDTRAVLADMQGRIRSMALLHESLYRSGTYAAVDLGAYLRQLATQAFRTQLTQHGAVRLELDLASVKVGMDQATPCGLLVNELISNCLKHGFPDARGGEVRVELHALDGGPQVRLRVSDTGVGLPANFEQLRGSSLGLQVVADLTGQLDGTLAIEPGPGAAFVVTFRADEPKPPVQDA